jgi:hypothetical protein
MKNPEPKVTVIRPNLTEEEREKRIEEVKAAMVKFHLAKMRREAKRNASID